MDSVTVLLWLKGNRLSHWRTSYYKVILISICPVAKLLERSGMSKMALLHTLYCLVEGDHMKTIADAVRGILDGHIILSRDGCKSHFPAIDIQNSVSRIMKEIVSEETL